MNEDLANSEAWLSAALRGYFGTFGTGDSQYMEGILDSMRKSWDKMCSL